MTARTCLPEPPCDWLTVTSWPVFAFQAVANAVFTSWYSSRVGSYDTFSSDTGDAASSTATPTVGASAARRPAPARVSENTSAREVRIMANS